MFNRLVSKVKNSGYKCVDGMVNGMSFKLFWNGTLYVDGRWIAPSQRVEALKGKVYVEIFTTNEGHRGHLKTPTLC